MEFGTLYYSAFNSNSLNAVFSQSKSRNSNLVWFINFDGGKESYKILALGNNHVWIDVSCNPVFYH